MLTQYKNIEEILTANQSISGERLPPLKNTLATSLKYEQNDVAYQFTTNIKREFHVYSGKTWITGDHDSGPWTQSDVVVEANKPAIKFLNSDIYDQFDKLKLTAGNYRIVINTFKNLIGSYEQQYLVVDEISPDRTEVKFKLIDTKNETAVDQLTKFIENVKQTTKTVNKQTNYYKPYLLNFSRNICSLFVNSVVINGEYLYVRLLDKLPDTINVDFKCWIIEELAAPYIDIVNIIAKQVATPYKTLNGPNWSSYSTINTTNETNFKNWSDLLGSSVQTSQQIIDSYFSGSLSGIELNIDFSDFNNFIFYSSAAERVANFRYKMQLIEQYSQQKTDVSAITSNSLVDKNSLSIQTNINNLISGFDKFEHYLFYGTHSKLTTQDIPLEYPTVPDITGSYIIPAPKQLNNIYSVTSSQFTNWFNTLYSTAMEYDEKNHNALRNAVPLHIRNSDSISNVQLFADMLGQHYDIIYTYINHMTRIHKREENPKLGMPNELLYSVAKQFGWELSDGRQSDDLWKYVFGVDAAGIKISGSNSVSNQSISSKDLTYATWRRIVNNLPLLLKTKGTKRSIHALMSCYGIPKSLISINEYGGPIGTDRTPVYEKYVSDYSLDLINNTTGTVSVNYSQSINSVELRFKLDDVRTNPMMPNTMTLYTIGNNSVTVDYDSGTLGKILINNTASGLIEIFDGGWVNTVLRTAGNKLELVAKRSNYGKIVSTVTTATTASFEYTGSVNLGVASAGSSRLQGQLQELRLWSSSLQNVAFNNHTTAASAYNGNVNTYDELIFRLPLDKNINHNLTSSLLGIQPKTSGISASFANWSNTNPYALHEEIYYFDSVSVGAMTNDDDKVRIETNYINGNLSSTKRNEVNEYDVSPLDTNQLGVFYSPQTAINEDILSHFGRFDLNDYIGDPGDDDAKSYPRLKQAAREYWKKYNDRPDFSDYIKIFSFFDLSFFHQLKQLLPARSNKMIGILIQQNLLERSKDTINPDLTYENTSYEALPISLLPDEIISDNNLIESQKKFEIITNIDAINSDVSGIINTAELLHTTSEIDYIEGVFDVITNETKYNGTDYAYENSNVPDWAFEPILPTILDQRPGRQRLPQALQNLFYAGCNTRKIQDSTLVSVTKNGTTYYKVDGTQIDIKLDTTKFNTAAGTAVPGVSVNVDNNAQTE